ncbi:MAG: ATP-binding protein [Myxococcota bacterium]
MSDTPPSRLAELAELGVITASLLHELRQPLFAVKGRLQLSLHGGRPLGPDEIEILLTHVGHIEELVEHYTGLGRADDSWTDLDLRDEIASATGLLAHRIRQIGATIEVETGEEPLYLRGRAVAIRQVVVNLVGNALDAVAAHERRRVRIRAARSGGSIVLEVVDSGPGVAPELRERLFEPFVTTKPPGRGTGLGLYIARKLAEEVGGTVRLDCPSAGGTRMVVELPSN